MKTFLRFETENWCMDLAYVDKQAKCINCVLYPLVRQDVFDRTLHAKGVKTKDSKDTVCAFLTMSTKKNRPKTNWVDKGTEFTGESKELQLRKAEGIQIYSIKAAFDERTMPSLKSILYRYMESYGYRYIHKWSYFVELRIPEKLTP